MGLVVEVEKVFGHFRIDGRVVTIDDASDK